MLTEQNNRVKGLGVVGAAVMALVIGAWTLPYGGPIADHTMSADINVPASIKDGQWCQAYALVFNGTSPYTFTWSGQFTNADAESGPLGADQIVNGYTSSARGNSLTLIVEDSHSPPQFDTVTVGWNWDTRENPDCEA